MVPRKQCGTRDLAMTKKENKKVASLLDRYFGRVYLAACHSRILYHVLHYHHVYDV
jgi:hypothetical protein